MGQDTRTKFIAIVILTVVAAYIVAPIPRKPSMVADAKINLGIDLAGGAELRYKILYPPGFSGNKEAATKIATDVIRRRVEAKQLKEPKINSRGDDEIIIQLAGVDADALRSRPPASWSCTPRRPAASRSSTTRTRSSPKATWPSRTPSAAAGASTKPTAPRSSSRGPR
jgi:preprotein translocase subunit SecD